ncbi:MAG: PAS domain S-box protein [Dechloromonas sp.]|nr:PAS domain S-box protein [Dechloromonas sp.]
MHDPAPTCRKILLLALVAFALAWGLSVLVPSLSLGLLLALLIVAGGGAILRVQHRMREQLRLQRRIIDHTSEAMMVTDREQRILMVNPAFEKITGYSAAEVLGQTPLMLGAGRHGADF